MQNLDEIVALRAGTVSTMQGSTLDSFSARIPSVLLLHDARLLQPLSHSTGCYFAVAACPIPLCSSSAITDMCLNSAGLWLNVSTS